MTGHISNSSANYLISSEPCSD